MSSGDAECDPDEGCITCGDVALALEVLEIDDDRGLALCRDDRGRRETVEIALVLPVEAGDQLLVHAGTAITHLSREVRQPARNPGTPGREAEVPGL